MNIPSKLQKRLENTEKVSELIDAIADILEEYDFGILAEHERRIEELEKKSLDKTAKSYQERSKFERGTDEIIERGS